MKCPYCEKEINDPDGSVASIITAVQHLDCMEKKRWNKIEK